VTRSLALLPLTLLLAGEVGLAQAPATGQQAAAPAAATAAVPTTGAPAQSAVAEKKSDPVEPQGFTYNAEGRRDPFVSLLRRGAPANDPGKRVAGLSGLGTAEVSLRGTLKSQGSFVGILQGVDNKTYIAHAGDKLADGSIRSITADAMVILQQVNDPLSLGKQQEVRKLLRQTEEGK
jgi:Tfp pilus assembly protein PilP